MSELGLRRLKDHRIIKLVKILKSNNPKNHNSDNLNAQGGRGRMHQLFGNEMNEIINELNEVLAA